MSKKRVKSSAARDRLLEVAFKLFSEQGFQGTTTQQIAKEAEVNEVTIFRLFGSKQSLLSAVLQEFIISKHILAWDEDGMLQKHADDPEGFFYELAREICWHLNETIPFVKMQMLEGSCAHINPEIVECIAQIPITAKSKLETIFKKCAELGWIEAKDSYSAHCICFYGPFFGFFMNKANFGDRIYPEQPHEMVKAITEIFLHGGLRKSQKD